jgi:hypothetical protein
MQNTPKPAHGCSVYCLMCTAKIKLGLPAPNPLGGAIQPQVTNHQLRWAGHRTPAGERPQAGDELLERERLDQVVIRPAVEPVDSVADSVAGGQHQHRRGRPRRPQPPARLEAVDSREHHVESDDLVVGRGGSPDPVLPRGDEIDEHALCPKASLQQRTHLKLILDDQHTHPTSLPES